MILDRCPIIVVASFIVSALLKSVFYTLNPLPSLRIHQNPLWNTIPKSKKFILQILFFCSFHSFVCSSLTYYRTNMSQFNTQNMQKLGIAAGAVVAGVLAYKLFSKKHCCAKKEVKTEEAKYFIGIDLGATNAKAGVVDKEGNLIAHASSRLENYEFEPVVDALVDACKKALVEAHLTFADITAIGVGSPGCIDFDVSLSAPLSTSI